MELIFSVLVLIGTDTIDMRFRSRVAKSLGMLDCKSFIIQFSWKYIQIYIYIYIYIYIKQKKTKNKQKKKT